MGPVRVPALLCILGCSSPAAREPPSHVGAGGAFHIAPEGQRIGEACDTDTPNCGLNGIAIEQASTWSRPPTCTLRGYMHRSQAEKIDFCSADDSGNPWIFLTSGCIPCRQPQVVEFLFEPTNLRADQAERLARIADIPLPSEPTNVQSWLAALSQRSSESRPAPEPAIPIAPPP